MFDFLWLEAFWMDYGQIIIAVSAAVTLIGAAFTLFKNNSISEKAVNRTEQAEGKLSVEHSKLSMAQERILERTADSKQTTVAVQAKIEKLQDTVYEMHRDQTTERVQRKIQFLTLKDAQKKLVSSADDIGKFAQDYLRIATALEELQRDSTRREGEQHSEIARLKSELEQLKKENAQLRLRLPRSRPAPSREDGWDMER